MDKTASSGKKVLIKNILVVLKELIVVQRRRCIYATLYKDRGICGREGAEVIS